MLNLKVVTGYVPIQGHPRSAKEYGELGDQIFGKLGTVPIRPYYERLSDCWLWKYVHSLKEKTTHSIGDNPAKNTLAYHCVQHQKFGWLLKAGLDDHGAHDAYVWIDYGIGHVPGVTPEVILAFLDRVKLDDTAVPGCWEAENALVNDFFPCWRFCGGVLVVPRWRLMPLYKAAKKAIRAHIDQTKNIWWEVNTMAQMERDGFKMRWYLADHNQTMFTGY